MRYTLSNSLLSVDIAGHGAELQELLYKGRNLLWNGDPRFWAGRSPVLFPYIARLTNGRYSYKNSEYHMDIHGFAKDKVFECISLEQDSVILELKSDAETLRQYPFDFIFSVKYTLASNELKVLYEVCNTGNRPLHFGVGGHPGFCMPLEDGLSFEDYRLVFSGLCAPERILFSEDKHVCGKEPFRLEQGRIIALTHDLFDNDAIVLQNTSGKVLLESGKGSLSLCISYAEFPYIGFWHTQNTSAPFLCIEPWSSLPSRKGVAEDLERQENLLTLEGNKAIGREWSVRVEDRPE